MARYQIIDTATGRKLNVVEWDGETPYEPPEGERIEPDDGTPVWTDAAAEPEPEVAPDLSDKQLAQALARAMGMTDKQLEAFRKKVVSL